MSTAERIKNIFADPDEQLTIITEDTTLEYDLGDGYRLDVVGQPDSDDGHPLQYQVYKEDPKRGRDTMFTVFEPPAMVFESDAILDKYAAVIEGLVHSDGAETFRSVVRELGEDHRNGRLLVIEDKLATMIQSTADVKFNPDNRNQPWEVYLVDDEVNSDWGMDRVRIRASQWTSDRPSFNLPTGLGRAPSGERWRQLRLIWTLMYARDAGVEIEDNE